MESLSHENIIEFKEFIQDSLSGYHIIITEYFQSLTIQEFLIQQSVEKHEVHNILKQIYNALNYIHSQNLIHRDFNINNILINPINHMIKIIDFGLSRFCQQEFQIYSPQGNLKYRSPQMIDSLNNPFFADVWNYVIVALSLLLRQKINSKKTWDMLQTSIEDPTKYSSNEDITNILMMLNDSINEDKEANYENNALLESPIKKFKHCV